MKLELTQENRESLEIATFILEDLIEDKKQAKEDLLSQVWGLYQGQYKLYLDVKIADIKGEITELEHCLQLLKQLIN